MLVARLDQPVCLIELEPSRPALWLARPFEDQPGTPSPPCCMGHDRRNRRVELTIARRVGGVGIELAGAAIDGVLIDLCKRRGPEMFDDRIEKSLAAAAL